MKTLRELQQNSTVVAIQRLQHSSGYISIGHDLYNLMVTNKYNKTFDFDVFLPSYNINLQRPFVWTRRQMEELIWSMIYERPIPGIVVILHEWKNFEIIDGKQRLMTIYKFMKNEFPIHYGQNEIFFDDLDDNAKKNITYRMVPNVQFYYSYDNEPIMDDQKIMLFNYYNFGGTPQENEHRDKLQNILRGIYVKNNEENPNENEKG